MSCAASSSPHGVWGCSCCEIPGKSPGKPLRAGMCPWSSPRYQIERFLGCRIFSLTRIRARATLPLLKAAGELQEELGTSHLMLSQPLRCFTLDFGVLSRGFGAPCWHRTVEKPPGSFSSLVPVSSRLFPAQAVGFDPLSKPLNTLPHPTDPRRCRCLSSSTKNVMFAPQADNRGEKSLEMEETWNL